MGETLFLAHRIPFPPNRGDKIRSHHLLKGLVRLGPVHVGTFTENAEDRAQTGALAQLASSWHAPSRSKPLALSGVQAVLSRRPVSLAAFDDASLKRWVEDTLSARPIDTIFVFSGQMAQYVPDSFIGRVIVDLCDVDSAKFEAYAQNGSRVWINRREGRLLREVEADIASRADVTLLISESEADLFRNRLEGQEGRDIRVLGNGVDTAFFDPDAVAPNEEIARTPGPHFVFTGQMDYEPNERAALCVIDAFMPAIREHFPTAEFHVVGRSPADLLKRRAGQPGVRIWGEVPDVRPFLAAADCVLAPMTIARGVQNKVLEAMAMARPVMLTREAATGIDGSDGKHFLIEQAEQWAMTERMRWLLAERSRGDDIGKSAREFVRERMSWEAVYSELAQIVSAKTASSHAA
ncbi:TIGR03087 family PEP-CTERM/XrtA system glycosyltransferase [Qipengyuania gaetbuli]|uniref:TIGR03087 family PEP-CTERM/XrtA system glycosyltransferase n=1 Tax=Qipengyuania gaetbuli TaxID=266952 RepID=UPI001CD316C7|nr:TIGR03087 family PEP-CTERM/XrtA system glycosyltransferase [Qipengyuania gaetbuli]MCA0911297.1 TIGR03087 family PEP-CTERM/XrtA system glycosyltransferase [Qipengyuania gaetbuli]